MKNIFNTCLVMALVITVYFYGFSVSAASVPTAPVSKDLNFQGKYVSQSMPDPISFEPGETKKITVTFKNTGSSVWEATGRNYVSICTTQPSYRKSLFAHTSWLGPDNPTKINKTTKSSEQAVFTFSLTAPNIPGDYTERFQLAVENKTWIHGTGFFLKLKVKNVSPSINEQPVPIISPYRAQALTPIPMYIQSKGDEVSRIMLSFKNTGTSTWENYSLNQLDGTVIESTVGGNTKKINFADASWISPQKIVEGTSVVEPEEILQIEFSVRAPHTQGSYAARFELAINNKTVPGGSVRFPVLVSEDGIVQNETAQMDVSTRALIIEPSIRVGLYKAEKEVVFQSEFPYSVYSGEELQGTLSSGEKATLMYNLGKYSFKGGELDFTTSDYIRLIPQDMHHYFTLVNYERKLSGRNTNFNTYRGSLEFKYSAKSALPYVINELPLDLYTAGVAETSNNSPVEYNKALAVAVRSYAYYHVSVRKPADLFDVYPTTASQLYLGYASELLMPKVAEIAQNTYGQMVTYEHKPVVTPYFSRSDGRTRSWKEVWGGDLYPWLKSVEAMYDQGKTMLGHGVGMSGSDALSRAAKDGWNYEQILKYYYTGTEVEKIY